MPQNVNWAVKGAYASLLLPPTMEMNERPKSWWSDRGRIADCARRWMWLWIHHRGSARLGGIIKW